MKKRKKILLTIISFTIFTPKIYADCTKEDINNFNKISDEYKVTYEFNKDSKLYNLIFYEPQPDKYVFVVNNLEKASLEFEDDNNYKYIGMTPGDYEITIEGITDKCQDVFKTINLNLPKYNEYSEDPLCEGNEEFVLCQPTYDKEIDYETFKSRLEVYKKTKQDNNQINKEKDNNKDNNIVDYIKNNIAEIIIITASLIILTIIIISIAKRQKKSRRLE